MLFVAVKGLIVRIRPPAEANFAKSHEDFMDPSPQPLYGSLSPWVVGSAIVDRHVEPFEEVLDKLCGELRAWVAAQRQGYHEC